MRLSIRHLRRCASVSRRGIRTFSLTALSVILAAGTLTACTATEGEGAAGNIEGDASAPPREAFTEGPVWRKTPHSAPLPPAWPQVRELFDEAITVATNSGQVLTWCAIAVDAPDAPQLCAGSDTSTYSASLPKIAVGLAAVEAYQGKVDTKVSAYSAYSDHGAAFQLSYDESLGQESSTATVARAEKARQNQTPTTLGDLVYAAIRYSDNDAFNQLVDLISASDAAPQGAFAQINAIGARKKLDEGFHVGNYIDKIIGWDWNHLTASGAAGYLANIVAAADGDYSEAELDVVHRDKLTTPRAARTVLEAMADQVRTTKIPAKLPGNTVANKTGETDTESHDMAVVGTSSGRYVLVAVSSFAAGSYPPDEDLGPVAEKFVRLMGGSAPL